MPQKFFFFIPDIGGFTSFVKEVEITHSQHIISELLELIIDSNDIGMSVAEIEGDAVFFYKADTLPSGDEILKQVEKTYVAFHEHLKKYETQRICPCNACSTAVNLSLKFIVDSGESQLINVKGKEKPFGESVIKVHRLLKNSIATKEYALLTDSLQQSAQLSELPEPLKGRDQYDDIGEIKYSSISLTHLLEKVPTPRIPKDQLLMTDPLKYSIEIEADKLAVCEWLIDMDKRDQWNKDVTEFKYKKGVVNRPGYNHVCVIGSQTINFETVTHDFGEGKIVYGERTTEIPIFKEATSYFIIEGVENQTTVNVEFHYQEKPILGFLFKKFLIKKLLKGLKTNLNNLKILLENTKK